MGIHHVHKVGAKWFRTLVTSVSVIIILSLVVAAIVTWPSEDTTTFRNKEYFFDDAQY